MGSGLKLLGLHYAQCFATGLPMSDHGEWIETLLMSRVRLGGLVSP